MHSKGSLRFEIILPRFYNNGKKIEAQKFLQTTKELAKRFGGCSFMPPFTGMWIDPKGGTEYTESSIGFYVDVHRSNENLRFFKEYRKVLEERFKQKKIKITYYPVKEV